MRSFSFELECHGQKVLAEIDEDMNLTLHGYDEEYEKSLMEFGEEQSSCADAIEYWNYGWYFKVITKHVFDYMDHKKVAALLAEFAEHAIDQTEEYFLFKMVILYARNFSEQKFFDIGFRLLDSHSSELNKTGWQSFKDRNRVKTNISDALINLLAWIRSQEPSAKEDQGYIFSFAGFLAEAVGNMHPDELEAYKSKEASWQIHRFLEFMQSV